MYYIGSEARNHEATIKDILQEYLLDGLYSEPYKAAFSSYGGVDVVFRDDEVEKAESAGRPYLDVVKGNIKTERWGKSINDIYYAGTRYLWTFEVAAIANDFSGAQTGAANPIASDTQLCDALVYLVDSQEGFEALEALGLEEAKIEASTERAEDRTRSNPYRITFTTHALPSYPPQSSSSSSSSSL